MVAFSTKYLLRNIFCSFEAAKEKIAHSQNRNPLMKKKASPDLKHPLPNLSPPLKKWRRRPKLLHDSSRTSDQPQLSFPSAAIFVYDFTVARTQKKSGHKAID